MADIISKPVGTTSDFGDLDYCFFIFPMIRKIHKIKSLLTFPADLWKTPDKL